MCDQVRQVLAGSVVISRRSHPDLVGGIRHLAETGVLTAVLPGVFAPSAQADDFVVRVLAVHAWDPDAVLLAEAAARLTFWPSLPVAQLGIASTRRINRPWLRVSERRIPPDLVVERSGLRCTAPALTAVDLGPDGVDTVLRARAATLADLVAALAQTPWRHGNPERRLVLADSRNEPWSAAERLTHRLLREDGITGWRTNYLIRLRHRQIFVDLAFPQARRAVEIDGFQFHSTPAAFQSDRARDNDLVLAGWRVLRFTWQDVTERPAVVLAAIRLALQG